MQRSADEHRAEFDEQGYTVFPGVLTPHDVEDAIPVFDDTINAETRPPIVTGDANNRNGRKQLSCAYCEPRLCSFAAHPAVLEAVAILANRPFRLVRSSIPCVTFKSPPGGERFESGLHVDWPHTPAQPHDETFLNGVLHFSTVQTGGGAFVVCPGSHRLVLKNLADPEMNRRMCAQEFNDGFPGLEPPQEICARAGDLLIYHAFLVHDRTENLRDEPRKVLFMHFKPFADEADRADARANVDSFHPDHRAAMDAAFRQLCGLE
jgi:ectoine hydroxylase-related dioxygenase (phytanoyl-CoA dioxygenase family)